MASNASYYASHLFLVYEPETSAMIDELVIRLPSSNYGSVNMYQLPDDLSLVSPIEIRSTSPLPRFDFLVLAIFHHPQSYSNLLAIEPALAAHQTVVFFTNPNALHQFEATGNPRYAHSLRLLLISQNCANDDITLQAFVWPISVPINRKNAHQLTFDHLFAQQPDPTSHLFWNRVRHIDQPITVVADLRPPSHLNECDPTAERCIYFGPYVLLAKQLASRLTRGLHPEPGIRPVQKDAVFRLREIFGNSSVDLRLNRESAKWRHFGDGFIEYNIHKEMQEDLGSESEYDSRRYVFTIQPAYRSGIHAFDVEDALMLVPYRRKTGCSQNVLDRLVLLLMWLLAVIVMAVVRLGAEWRGDSCPLGRLLIETWAMSIGTTGGSRLLRPYGAVNAQRLAVVSLSVYAILAGSYFTGALVQDMIRCDGVRQIAAVDEVAASWVDWMVPIEKFPSLYE